LLMTARKYSSSQARYLILLLAHVTAKGLLCGVLHDSSMTAESLRKSVSHNMITCAQAEVCLQVLTSTLIKLDDPLLAALAIQVQKY
jgi:hypothetical protein